MTSESKTFHYQIIKRRALMPQKGRKTGDVYIVRDRISGAEVATCLSLDDAQSKVSKRNAIHA